MTRAFLVAVLCATVIGQEPEQHAPPLERPIVERLLLEVNTRLRSDKPDSVAWGAYLTGRFGLAEALPGVRLALQRDHGDGTAGRLARLHLLDAVVRVDATVPAEVLKANAKGPTLPPCLIVMARQPVSNVDTLRELFAEHAGMRGDPMAWRVAGNLLAAQKARGFAVHLLESTRFDLHLIVTDQEDLQLGIGARAGGAFADGRMEVPAAFPPTPQYRLVTEPETGDVLLADGPTPVFWRRSERAERRFGIGARRVHLDRPREHLRWLEAMAGRELFGADLPVSSHRMVVFEDREQFAAAVADLRKGMHAAFDRVLEELVDTTVLTSEETSGLFLDLEVTLHDQRRDKSVDLPAINQR